MLRVRPVLFTSKIDEHAALLLALGLSYVQNSGDWRLLDSGNGRVGLHRAPAGSPQDGTLQLGFEIRDREIFVSRTCADGTAATLVDSGHGPAARVTAPDGFSFLADPVIDAPDHETPSCQLSVIQVWQTPDADAARTVLANIGARPVPNSHQAFVAKNGGFVEVQTGPANGVELCFVYDGDLTDLRTRLTAAELESEFVADTLQIAGPQGTSLHIRRSNA